MAPVVATFALDGITPTAWQNGGGTTRQIATGRLEGRVGDRVEGRPEGPAAHDRDVDWRLSLADIGVDGPFSVFPGLDRYAMLLAGRGLTLRGDASVWQATPFVPFAFPGDAALDATLRDGLPAQCLNLMVRRGAGLGEIALHARDIVVPRVAAAVVLVLGGTWAWRPDHSPGAGDFTLAAGHGAIFTPSSSASIGLVGTALTPDARAVVATVRRAGIA